MARSFVAASSQRITQVGAISGYLSASAGTVVCWFRPTGTAPTAGNSFDNAGPWSDSLGYIGVARRNTGGVDRIWAFNYTSLSTEVGVTYVNDTWIHIGWRHGGGNLDIFANGASGGTVASGNTGGVTGTFQQGASYNPNYLNGAVAEFAVYNVALDDAEMKALGLGFSPLLVRPSALKLYRPFIGRESPELDLVGGVAGTLVNAPTTLEHPTVIYPRPTRSRRWAAPVAPGGGFMAAWAMGSNVVLSPGAF